MHLPFLKKTVMADGSAVYKSKTSYLEVIQADAKDLNSTVIFKAPAFNGHEAYEVEIRGEATLAAEYAEYWLRWVSVEIGTGFHPDTRAEDYVPGLPSTLNKEYDEMIGFCFENIDDPYKVGLDAWGKAGLIDSAPSAPGM
ncbi:hypothetical protein [Mesorhizobium sp. SP-1A]|uniref:hypothetical protein n=1 Tax=Mesorhizobium sp. SP-1A TaxID=3077840 RepID=UPI0028F73B0A|nr:hypothetical protein [Mesorhizobium sp. SP-1A]